MPRGVPSRIQVGAARRTYTFREIANGTGLSISLVSLIFRGKRPVSPYAQNRLAAFFEISVKQLLAPDTIRACALPVRPMGRVVGWIHYNGVLRPVRSPALNGYDSSPSATSEESSGLPR